MNKQELRKYLQSLSKGKEVRDQESSEICRHILQSDAYRNATVIGGYVPLQREADIMPVLEAALCQGKTLALPRCEKPPVMSLRRVDSLKELVTGAYGIPEPGVNSPLISVQEVDLLLVPLEGIDEKGHRLGKGGGYYDHLLADVQVMTLGCALSWQFAKCVPHEAWDIALSACVDQYGLHCYENEKHYEKGS